MFDDHCQWQLNGYLGEHGKMRWHQEHLHDSSLMWDTVPFIFQSFAVVIYLKINKEYYIRIDIHIFFSVSHQKRVVFVFWVSKTQKRKEKKTWILTKYPSLSWSLTHLGRPTPGVINNIFHKRDFLKFWFGQSPKLAAGRRKLSILGTWIGHLRHQFGTIQKLPWLSWHFGNLEGPLTPDCRRIGTVDYYK